VSDTFSLVQACDLKTETEISHTRLKPLKAYANPCSHSAGFLQAWGHWNPTELPRSAISSNCAHSTWRSFWDV